MWLPTVVTTAQTLRVRPTDGPVGSQRPSDHVMDVAPSLQLRAENPGQYPVSPARDSVTQNDTSVLDTCLGLNITVKEAAVIS